MAKEQVNLGHQSTQYSSFSLGEEQVVLCCSVSSASMKILHRGLPFQPVVNRCLFSGQWPVRIPMTFLSLSLFSLIRLLTSLFDATGKALFVCLFPCPCLE